jgi:hypothetical protein
VVLQISSWDSQASKVNPCFFFHGADCSEDSDSVDEGTPVLAGSNATKRKRARQILKSPHKKVRVKGPHYCCSNFAVRLQLVCSLRIVCS